jgi:hypothetical protein
VPFDLQRSLNMFSMWTQAVLCLRNHAAVVFTGSGSLALPHKPVYVSFPIPPTLRQPRRNISATWDSWGSGVPQMISGSSNAMGCFNR